MTSEATTWDDILDDYEDLLDEYNDALDGERIPDMEPEPILHPPSPQPTAAHRQRLAELQAEAKSITDRLASAMRDNHNDRVAGRDRVNARRRYAGLRYQP